MGIFITAFTLLMIFRDAVLDTKYREVFLLKYAPSWPWQVWLIIGLFALLLLTLESGYSKHRSEKAAFQSRYKTRIAELRKAHQDELTQARLDTFVKHKATPEPEPITITPEEQRLAARIASVNRLGLIEELPEETESAPVKSEPILVCKKVDAIPVYWTGHKFIREKEPKDDGLYAVVAELINRPNAKGYVPPIEFLTAQITFYDAEGEYYGRVAHAFWLEHELCHIELGAGDRGKLILAVGHRGYNMVAVDNHKARAISYEQKEPFEIKGKRFRLHVYLSVKETVSFNFTYETEGFPKVEVVDDEKD